MKVYTRTVYDWIDNRYKVIAENSRLYFGPVAYCKGASAEQKALAQQQADFSKTLQASYSKTFANNQAILNAVKGVYDPILAMGINQFGFGAPEEAALRTQASEGTAAQYKATSGAVAERMAAAGGGNTFLPSGVQADIQGKIAGGAAAQESEQQLGITKLGYDVGRQNFLQASNAEMAAAAGYNPLGYAGASNSVTSSAFNMASEIQKANAAASPWGIIGGVIGGGLSAFLGNPAGIGGFLGRGGSVNNVPRGSSGDPNSSFPGSW